MRKKSGSSDRPIGGSEGRGSGEIAANGKPGSAQRPPLPARPARAHSLMKTTALATGNGAGRKIAAPAVSTRAKSKAGRKTATSSATPPRQDKIEERITAATEELASGITEAAAASEELRRAMEQIASGAEEAASA